MAAIGWGLGAAAAAVGAITGRTSYELSEVELPGRERRKFDLRSLEDVEALACLLADEEVIVAGFRELVDEFLPVLRADAALIADCPPGDSESEGKEAAA